MVGNNVRKTVTADRSHRERATYDDLHNGVQYNYYDGLNINESIPESDEHNNEDQIRATNQSIVKEGISPVEPNFDSYPAINLNNMAQVTKRPKTGKNTSKNIDKTYSFKVNHSGN
jgi:hypothetical protein